MTIRYGWWPDCMHEQGHGAYVKYKDHARLQSAIRKAISQLEGVPDNKVQRVVNSLSKALNDSSQTQLGEPT